MIWARLRLIICLEGAWGVGRRGYRPRTTNYGLNGMRRGILYIQRDRSENLVKTGTFRSVTPFPQAPRQFSSVVPLGTTSPPRSRPPRPFQGRRRLLFGPEPPWLCPPGARQLSGACGVRADGCRGPPRSLPGTGRVRTSLHPLLPPSG